MSRTTTYCGRSAEHEPSTRFHLLVTCGDCHALERFYTHLGIEPTAWQHDMLALLLRR